MSSKTSHHKIEFDQRCKDCGGTGLYVGMAERDGFAVVCRTCSGTGCRHVVIEYDDFEKRKEKHGVVRVLHCNPGICVGSGDLTKFGGMSYDEWQAGNQFPAGSEMREFTCPAWWYQCADYDRKPKWEECYASLGGTFSKCPYFANKKACWARFDQESTKGAQ